MKVDRASRAVPGVTLRVLGHCHSSKSNTYPSWKTFGVTHVGPNGLALTRLGLVTTTRCLSTIRHEPWSTAGPFDAGSAIRILDVATAPMEHVNSTPKERSSEGFAWRKPQGALGAGKVRGGLHSSFRTSSTRTQSIGSPAGGTRRFSAAPALGFVWGYPCSSITNHAAWNRSKVGRAGALSNYYCAEVFFGPV